MSDYTPTPEQIKACGDALSHSDLVGMPYEDVAEHVLVVVGPLIYEQGQRDYERGYQMGHTAGQRDALTQAAHVVYELGIDGVAGNGYVVDWLLARAERVDA